MSIEKELKQFFCHLLLSLRLVKTLPKMSCAIKQEAMVLICYSTSSRDILGNIPLFFGRAAK